MIKSLFLSIVTLFSSWINPVVPEKDPSGSVLAATTTSESISTPDPVIFTVNVPANFNQNITAPNIIYSLTAGRGISISDGQLPTITNTGVLSINSKTGTLSLTAGEGITIDGLKITNSGIKSLSAGDGIEIDGTEITNTGILSLEAGDGISIDGNTITNSREAPDYGLSGWTDNGSSIVLTTTTDSVTVDGLTVGNTTVSNGKSILPSNDLGSDLGSSSYRFNNLWVANINSNSSQSFSGQTTFSYAPTDTTVSQASVLINPTSSATNGQLLGLGIAGYQRALIDKDGDLVLGYNSATSAPATDYPLNIYGHSGTRVAYVDTDGKFFGLDFNPGGGYQLASQGLTIGGSFTISNVSNTFGDMRLISASSGAGVNLTFDSPADTLKIRNLTNTADGTLTAGLITASSQVGIGTTSPTSKLHISGAVTGKALAIFDETGGEQNILVASASGTNRMILTNTGRLGLGVTSPTLKLEVSDGTNTFRTEGWGIDIGTSTKRFEIQTNNDNPFSVAMAAGTVLFRTSGSTTTGDFVFAPANSNDTAKWLVLKNSGNVGIGTTSPSSALSVGSSSQFRVDSSGFVGINRAPDSSYRIALNGDIDLTSGNFIKMSGYGVVGGSDSLKYVYGGSTSLNLVNPGGWPIFVIETPNVTTAERMRITSTGNVGIGTSSPTSLLHVTGAVTGKALSIFNETGGEQNILVASASGTNRLVLTNGGRLGIGVSSPTTLVDIYGSMNGDWGFKLENTGTTGSGLMLKAGNKDDASARYILGGYDNQNYLRFIFTAKGGFALGYTDGFVGAEPGDGNAIIQGQIGLGTKTPTSKLHVSGAVTGKALAIFDTTGDQNVLVASASGTTKLVIDNAGRVKVGDGTSSLPSISFNSDGTKGFYSAGTNTIGLSFQGYNAMTLTPSYMYGESVTGRSAVYIGGGAANLPNYTFYADTDTGMFWGGTNTVGISTNEIERIRISSTGNVGIGSTSPTSLLHLSGAVTGKALAIFDETGNNQDLFTASAAGVTKLTIKHNGLVNATTGGLATYTKAGTISDTDFTDTAINGLMGWDSTNDRLYIRNGDAWEYIAKTGGFQIPDYEAENLEVGDYLIPYVESKMSDGGVHGLYAKWSEVKNDLLSGITQAVATLQSTINDLKTKITTQEICLENTCINEDQLKKILETLPSPTPTPTQEVEVTPTPTPETTPTPESSPSAIPQQTPE